MTALEDADRKALLMRRLVWGGVAGGLVLWCLVAPAAGASVSFGFYLMLWITMASAFNVISGFAGYMPFGYVAFYGIGAFATAILTKKAGWPIWASIPAAGVAGLMLSLLFARTLRLSGIYFAIVSLALSIICRLIITNMPEEITGGSFGINIGSRPQPLQSYYAMLAVMVLALLTVTWLAGSRLGRALKAIRDDADAADAMGVNVPRVRLQAWMIAAVFPSLCGGIEAWYTNVVDTETAFNVLVTAKTVIYAIAGGLGTVLGPVVGTIVMVVIDDMIWRRFPILNLFLLGFAIVLLIQFMPRGIVGTIIRRWPRLRRWVM